MTASSAHQTFVQPAANVRFPPKTGVRSPAALSLSGHRAVNETSAGSRAHLHLWLAFYFAPGILANFAQTAGIGFTHEVIGGIPVSSPTALGGTLMILGFLAFLAAIVDLGFLKGKAASSRGRSDQF